MELSKNMKSDLFNTVSLNRHIDQNVVCFFHLGCSKNGIFDDVIIKSSLRSDNCNIRRKFLDTLIKWILWMTCAKIC